MLMLESVKGSDKYEKVQNYIICNNRKREDDKVKQRLKKKLNTMFSSKNLLIPITMSPTRKVQPKMSILEFEQDLSPTWIKAFDMLQNKKFDLGMRKMENFIQKQDFSPDVRNKKT
jgi:hypothetical protein